MGQHSRQVDHSRCAGVDDRGGAVGDGSLGQDDPEFNPSGEIYDTADLVDERFVNSSPIEGALFIVEAENGGDALTRDVLFEFKQNSDALRSNSELSPDLAVQFRS